MNISSLIDRLNNELEKLNKLKNSEFDTNNFFTTNQHFNDNHDEYIAFLKNIKKNEEEPSNSAEENSNSNFIVDAHEDIQPDNETKSLTLVKPNYLITAQTMFKKTIKFSLKSFLISISLSFLNLFV